MKNNFYCEGELAIQQSQLNLDLTLLGGQSFRWRKVEHPKNKHEWHGVVCDAFWILTQTAAAVRFKAFPSIRIANRDKIFYEKFLKQYFRIDFNLPTHNDAWKAAHPHFAQLSNNLNAVRVLDQDPFENILTFICSQNNNIKRITSMIDWLSSTFGTKIGEFYGRDEFTFPSLKDLIGHKEELDSLLRSAKFGYRAKFIAQSVWRIEEFGGEEWFKKLRDLPYAEARLELVKLPGIGFKIADCICLMSLNHLEAVPVDTHIFKIAQKFYMPHLGMVKSVTPKVYDDIANHFREVYGNYAGWAQTVLFCSDLQQFQSKKEKIKENLKRKASQ